MLRIAKLQVIMQRWAAYFNFSNFVLGILGFFRLCILVLFFAHWIGCFWYLLGNSGDDKYNWISLYNTRENNMLN